MSIQQGDFLQKKSWPEVHIESQLETGMRSNSIVKPMDCPYL